MKMLKYAMGFIFYWFMTVLIILIISVCFNIECTWLNATGIWFCIVFVLVHLAIIRGLLK